MLVQISSDVNVSRFVDGSEFTQKVEEGYLEQVRKQPQTQKSDGKLSCHQARKRDPSKVKWPARQMVPMHQTQRVER